MVSDFETIGDEAAQVRSAQAGDRAAFGAIYNRYARMVHGILLAHLRYTDAEDVMQDVFVRALQQLPSLREPAAFGGWLGTFLPQFDILLPLLDVIFSFAMTVLLYCLAFSTPSHLV